MTARRSLANDDGRQRVLEGFEPNLAPYEPEDQASGEEAPYGYGFFLALVPASTAEAAFLFAHSDRVHKQLGVPTRRIQPAMRLHATILALDGLRPPGEPPARLVIDGIRSTLEQLALPSVPMRFTHVRGYAGQALTLRTASAEHRALVEFRSVLAGRLRAGAGTSLASSGAPHISLQYHLDISVGDVEINPIEWHAKSLALILSLRGMTRHKILGSWELG